MSENELVMNRPVTWVERPPFPHNIMMELTNCCNHKCVFCTHEEMIRPKRQCDKALMMDIMGQAYENGTREIGFYLMGEPLLCRDLAEYIGQAKALGFEYIYLTTNGALANVDRMRELIDAGLNSIKFSVNAATKETYLAIHGKDDFLTVKENIKALKHYIDREHLKLPIFISFIKNELNKNDIEALYAEFEHVVDKIYLFDCTSQGGSHGAKLVKNGVVQSANLIPMAKVPCEMIFNCLHITCEGYLNACCYDADGYLSVADLRKMTLREAWNCEQMVDLRRQHLQNKLKNSMCYNCIHLTDIALVPINAELMTSPV